MPNELMYTPSKDSHLLACVAHLKTVDLEITEPHSSVSDYRMYHFCYSYHLNFDIKDIFFQVPTSFV